MAEMSGVLTEEMQVNGKTQEQEFVVDKRPADVIDPAKAQETISRLKLIDPLADPGLSSEARAMYEASGAKVIEKGREVTIPVLPEEDGVLAEMSGLPNPQKIRRQLTTLLGYLDQTAIVDRFGNDHSARRDWREGLRAAGGTNRQLYEELVENRNQFRSSNIFPLRLTMEAIAHACIKNGRQDAFDAIRGLANALPGQYDYSRMTLSNKISTVRQLENTVASVAQVVMGNTSETKTVPGL